MMPLLAIVSLFADKSGDVYKCQLSEPDAKPQLILGHISMVLDMVCNLLFGISRVFQEAFDILLCGRG